MAQFGPDITFFGIPRCDLADPASGAEAKAIILGAPFDSGTSYRSGARLGPKEIRSCDYSAHNGRRPHLALRVDGLADLHTHDAGDVLMPPTDTVTALAALRQAVGQVLSRGAVPITLGGDHTVAQATIGAMADHFGPGRIAVIHLDAHSDTADIEFGSQYGHGQPMRRVIEAGEVRADRFIQIGLRGYWPGADNLAWMAEKNMHSFEMAEIGARGLTAVLCQALDIAAQDTDGVYLSVDIDVADPAVAPGTGTPEPGGLTARELLDTVRRIARESQLVGMEIVEVCPAYDQADITSLLANRVVLETLAGMARARADTRSGQVWDQATNVLADRRSHP